jgi:hypothetical protein
MSNFTQIIKDALEYYDNNQYKYYDKINNFKYYSINQNKKNIIFYNKKKEKIYESEYELIGKYINYSNIWIWAWADSRQKKELINTSRKILNYGLDLDENNELLKTELITSRIQITTPIQIDIHTSLASFLSKQPFIFKLNYYGSQKSIISSDGNEIFNIKNKKTPIYSVYLILSNQ